MVKLQKRVRGNYIVSFPNNLMDYYSFINEMNFTWYLSKKGLLFVPLKSW